MAPLAQLGSYLSDLFFPPRCVGCTRAGSAFCPQCAQAVLPMAGPICAHCGRPQPKPTDACPSCRQAEYYPFPLARVATFYTDPLRPAIHALKYGGKPELAGPLARYLVAVAQQPSWLQIVAQSDAILPVPLHAERLAERGYNQSALLAKAFADQVGAGYTDAWLQRTRQTQSQVGLSAIERQQNVAHAFLAAPDVGGKRLILVDDVITTGATLAACAHALREAGAEAVYGLILSTPTFTQDGSVEV